MNTKIYTVNYQRKDGTPGWTSIWAASAREAVDAVAEQAAVARVVRAVPHA